MSMRVQPTISDYAYSRFSQMAEQRGTKVTEEIALVLEWHCRSSGFSDQLNAEKKRDFESDLSQINQAEAAIALIKSLITGTELDPGAIALAAKHFNVAPHELQQKLQGGKQNGDHTISRSVTNRPV